MKGESYGILYEILTLIRLAVFAARYGIAAIGPTMQIVEWRLCWYNVCSALQRQFCFYISFLGIARPQPQFPHSCVCERFIYSQDRSTYSFFSSRKGRPNVGIYIIRSQTHECWNWDWGPDIPFLGIFVSNFRHFVFAVRWWCWCSGRWWLSDVDAFLTVLAIWAWSKIVVVNGDADVADITIDKTFIYLRVLHFGD